MTDYEAAALAASAFSNFLAAFGVFLSLVTAYIVATYVAAKKLTSFQISIVNLSFLVSVGILGYLVIATFRVFYGYAALTSAGSIGTLPGRPALVDFTWPLMILLSGIVIGCGAFMYSVRYSVRRGRE